MASIFKPSYTKPIPPDAEIIHRDGQRFARFEDRTGTRRRVPLTKDGRKLRYQQRKWWIQYTDANGRVCRVAGFADKIATEQRAAQLERAVARCKAGIIDTHDELHAQHLQQPLDAHVEAYRLHLQVMEVSAWHLRETLRRLNAILSGCNAHFLNDITATHVERWLKLLTDRGTAARTRNTYLSSLKAFLNWCVTSGRLAQNPLQTVRNANEQADIRRRRRALTEDELQRLMKAARKRPLIEAMTIRRGKNKGKLLAKIRPETRARLERLGHERALIYKILVLTGLRRGELASITWGQLELDHAVPAIHLYAGDAKNRRSEIIPLRRDLANDLRSWKSLQSDLHPSDKLFTVPMRLVSILNLDLKAAGIPKVDARGFTFDVHAFRHTTATHLSKSGIAPRVAQSVMRHSDIKLTMQTYTDPRLLNVAEALDALPDLPLENAEETDAEARATGTDNSVGSQHAHQHAQETDFDGQNMSVTGTPRTHPNPQENKCVDDASGSAGTRKDLLSPSDNRSSSKRVKGLEPSTFSLEG